MDPLISVVIPVYNSEKYLKEAVNSFIQQTYQHLEIICVDDGSTDSSLRILEDLAQKDQRVKVYRQKNAGAGAARNNGISYARGEYIYFFDSDDLADKKLLEKTCARALETDADIVAFHGYTFTNDDLSTKKFQSEFNKNILKDASQVFSYRDYPESILSTVNIVPWNKLIRLAFIKENNIAFEEISSTNDLTFSAVCLAAANRIALVDSPLVYYRLGHAGTVTSTKSKNLQNVITAVESAEKQIKKMAHAGDLSNSLSNFTVENYCYSFFHYTDDFSSERSEKFYGFIRSRFSEAELGSLKREDFRNKKIFALYHSIKEHTYEQMLEIRSKKIIVSFTSFPKRIIYAHKVVSDMAAQKLKPSDVLLWLAEEQFPNRENDLPPELRSCADRGLVKIKWCARDLRPHKKYLYAMLEYPDDIVITVDDDLEYPSDLVSNLYFSYLCFPDCVSAVRTYAVAIDKVNKKVFGCEKWIKDYKKELMLPSKQLLATTGAGTLFPPGVLSGDALNEDLIEKLCPYADDIWIHQMLVANDVKTVCCADNFYLRYTAPQEGGLAEFNDGQNQNDVQYAAVQQYLKEKHGYDIVYQKLEEPDNGFDLSDCSQLLDYCEYLRLNYVELNKKLTATYREKSKINARLLQTFDEKAQRGVEIKKLKADNIKLKNQLNKFRKSLIFRIYMKLKKLFKH